MVERTESTAGSEMRINEADYPGFLGAFEPADRREMIDQDMAAGVSIPILLTSIIFLGFLLALLSIWLTA